MTALFADIRPFYEASRVASVDSSDECAGEDHTCAMMRERRDEAEEGGVCAALRCRCAARRCARLMREARLRRSVSEGRRCVLQQRREARSADYAACYATRPLRHFADITRADAMTLDAIIAAVRSSFPSISRQHHHEKRKERKESDIPFHHHRLCAQR